MADSVTILVEAEQFADYGGWLLDQQFMDQMGSPYLLAHGLGRPVADAVTTVAVPRSGTYRVWVRTLDWVAPWGVPGTPGAFQVLVNGVPLEAAFGTEGAAWHWQAGGAVALPAGDCELALHDLTGFESRCDVILITSDHAATPPNDLAGLVVLRHKLLGLPAAPADGGEFDFVVIGGGIAGMCAAVAAARSGLEVALVQDRPVFGGNNSSEIRVWLGGDTNLEPYPRIGDLVREIEPERRAHAGAENSAEIYEDDRRIAWLNAEKNLTVLPLHRAIAAEMEEQTIRAVVAQDVTSGRQQRIRGRWFADCTGDGALGALAAADSDMTMTGHMGPSNLWYVIDTGEPEPFPRCPWALDLSDKPFPGRGKRSAQWAEPGLDSLGRWFWENGFDLDPIADAERMRDTNLRAMYGAWDALKNVDGLYPTHRLGWAAHIAGKRESRRLLGDVVVNRGDLYRQRSFPDACVPCTWHMDLHVPHREYQAGFEGEEFISWCVIGNYPRPFWLPYRALYSRNITNLFMAGRDISVTHEALGTARLMRTGGMMGEVIGLAAALCAQRRGTPRDVYTAHLEELKALMSRGVGSG